MISRILCALLLLAVITARPAAAQCTPDITITTPGIYPDSATGLPAGTVGVPYSEVIQLRVPTDTFLFGQTVIITDITITGVTGLPPGITYACNPSNCVFPGGSNGCVLLSGTPTVAGVFNMNVDLLASGTIFGIPTSQPMAVDYYIITINSSTGLEPLLSNLKFEMLPNKPNPATVFTDVTFTSPVGGDFTIKVFNMIGKEVYHQAFRGMAGLNSFRVETVDFIPGIYMISMEHGSDIVTRRMIVSKK